MASGTTRQQAETDTVTVAVASRGDVAGRVEVRSGGRTTLTAPAAARAAVDAKAFARASAGDALGEPRSAMAPVHGTPAWQQVFDTAWVIWHPSHGACVIRRHSPIAVHYATMGGPSGPLGCPVGDEVSVGTGALCPFAAPGGVIAWHPNLGAHALEGPIGEYWLDTGGPRGRWGFPTSAAYADADGCDAVNFEGGTLTWGSATGIGLRPQAPDTSGAAWLALFDEPPRRSGAGRAAGETRMPAGVHRRDHSSEAADIADHIDACRSLLDDVQPSPHRRRPERLTTSITPEEMQRFNTTPLPPGVTAHDLHRAELELWRDLWATSDGPSAIRAMAGDTLTWDGFAADGDLEFLLTTLFARAPHARRLLLHAGISVAESDGRSVLVAADTQRRWRLYGIDAERYISADRRLLALLQGIAEGRVPEALLAEADLPADCNTALCRDTRDAQFITVVSRAGRLPGWSLVKPWTAELRAAVTHNIHAGCLTGWHVYEPTGGDPVEVVRRMAWDFFCGPAALLAQSRPRFEGSLSHGVLAAAARSFPPARAGDDGHARYILTGGIRRRVDPPS